MDTRLDEVEDPPFLKVVKMTEFEARMIGDNGDFYKFMMERAGLVPVGTYPYNRPINGVDACAWPFGRFLI